MMSVAELPVSRRNPDRLFPERPRARWEEKIKSESLKGERAVTVYTPAGYDPRGMSWAFHSL